jgi:hypothetical protein
MKVTLTVLAVLAAMAGAQETTVVQTVAKVKTTSAAAAPVQPGENTSIITQVAPNQATQTVKARQELVFETVVNPKLAPPKEKDTSPAQAPAKQPGNENTVFITQPAKAGPTPEVVARQEDGLSFVTVTLRS